jgi:hypothetical protein
LYQLAEGGIFTPFVADFHHSLLYMGFIGKSASFL